MPPGHASAPLAERGIGFGLSDDDFNRWWHGALLPEDANEFVHFYGGTLDGARFACALTYLTNVDRRAMSNDIIVRAYLAAKNLPDSELRNVKARYEAQALYDEDSVQTLLERVRRRTRYAAEDRIIARTAAKIEELFNRTRTVPDGDDERAEFEMNGGIVNAELRFDTEKLALDAALRFMANTTKERSHDMVRRDKRAFAAAVAANQGKARDASAPPNADEAKQFLAMLHETLGTEQFTEIVASMIPAALPSGNAQEDTL